MNSIKDKILAAALTLAGVGYYLTVGGYLFKHISGIPYFGF